MAVVLGLCSTGRVLAAGEDELTQQIHRLHADQRNLSGPELRRRLTPLLKQARAVQLRAANVGEPIDQDTIQVLNHIRDNAYKAKYGLFRREMGVVGQIERELVSGYSNLDDFRHHFEAVGVGFSEPDPAVKGRIAARLGRLSSLLNYWDMVRRPQDKLLSVGTEMEMIFSDQMLAELIEFGGDGTLGSLTRHYQPMDKRVKLSSEERAELEKLIDVYAYSVQLGIPMLNAGAMNRLRQLQIRDNEAKRYAAYQMTLSFAGDAARSAGKASAHELTADDVMQRLGPSYLGNLIGGATGRQTYGGDKRIPGIRLRESARLRYGFGKSMRYISIADAQAGASGAELDRITYGSAGRAVDDAFAISDELQAPMPGLHTHVVEKRRNKAGRTEVAAAVEIDHWRRTNLLAELLAAGTAGALNANGDEHGIWFDHSNASKIDLLWAHLVKQRRLSGDEKVALKMCAIGYRIGNYIDEETGEVDPMRDGYEVRIIERDPTLANLLGEQLWPDQQIPAMEGSATHPALTAWVNAIQRTVATTDAVVNEDMLEQWRLQQHGGRPAQQFLRSMHYYDPRVTARSYYERLPDHVRAKLSYEQVASLHQIMKKNYAVGMLLHNWQADSIWSLYTPATRRIALAKVHAAQVRALDELASGRAQGAQLHRVIATFVRDAGLIEHVGRSLGVQDVALIQRHF